MNIYILFAIYVFLSAGGLVLFKLGSKSLIVNLSLSNFSISCNWYVILGIVAYLLSFILWLIIVSMSKLSLALPISVGIVNVLVLLGSALFLNEIITLLQCVGIVIIIVGIFILTIGGKI